MIKHHEFWHPRVFETPYYLYLAGLCLRYGLGVRDLSKANYALDHGEIGIGSKYATQMAFAQQHFLPTLHLPADLSIQQKTAALRAFIHEHKYPIILKSDVGCVGKGICKITSEALLEEKTPRLLGDYIAQRFTSLPLEYGVFYVRLGNRPMITSINRKHFPSVVGNGQDTLAQLAQQHPRFTAHWQTFLQYFNADEILPAGEERQLSFIGSHTMGCCFTDDSHLITPDLEREIFTIFNDQPGFNFGRLDVKTQSEAAFRAGQFKVIEINGIASLPTHMFDPKYRLRDSYRIFLKHAEYLVQSAFEHRHQSMPLLPLRAIIQRAGDNQRLLNRVHAQLMQQT